MKYHVIIEHAHNWNAFADTIFSIHTHTHTQAYAEIEENTPGQIFGMAFKKDGKSSAENSDNLFTQGTKDDRSDEYKSHDQTDTHEYRRDKIGSLYYFSLGFALFVAASIWYMSETGVSQVLDYERDKTLREQAEAAAEEQRQYLATKQATEKRSKYGTLSDA